MIVGVEVVVGVIVGVTLIVGVTVGVLVDVTLIVGVGVGLGGFSQVSQSSNSLVVVNEVNVSYCLVSPLYVQHPDTSLKLYTFPKLTPVTSVEYKTFDGA